MQKHEAHRIIDAGGLTWGALKTLLRAEMGAPAHRSVVNAGMSHQQAIDILARSIEGEMDDGFVCDLRTRRPSRDRMIATNILRECSASVHLLQRPEVPHA